MAATFPFSAIVGQDEMKRSILIAAIGLGRWASESNAETPKVIGASAWPAVKLARPAAGSPTGARSGDHENA